jgi:hypothetical protein
MRRRGGVLAVVSGVVLMLAGMTGCADPPASPLPSDGPTTTPAAPAFASLDEATEAAVVTLQRYMDVANEIGADGGRDAARLFEVVDQGEWAAGEIAMFEDLERTGRRLGGPSVFSKPRLMQYLDAEELVQLYACFDVSGARILDSTGTDITPERPEQAPFLVTFRITPPRTLTISKAEVWDRPGIC